MGVAALCCGLDTKGIGVEHQNEAALRRRLRPLLADLEGEFDEWSGEDKSLDAIELSDIWKERVKNQQGLLSVDDCRLIETASKHTVKQIDVDGNGRVSVQEFVAFSLGAFESRGALRDIRSHLKDALRKDPSKLTELVDQFRKWDNNGDGYLTKEELSEHVRDLYRAENASGSEDEGGNLNDEEVMRKLRDEIFDVVDVDGDGRADLWEFVAWALGRRRTPVELLLYDFTKGMTKWAGPLLLGRTDVEIFHSSTLVFGSEWWYGGDIFRTKPPAHEHFGWPMTESPVLNLQPSEVRPDLHVCHLGYTFVTHQEFVQFLRQKMLGRYKGRETYDFLTHSCNHFSDECAHFLLGHGIPPHVLAVQKMALTPAIERLRPIINKKIGFGFSELAGGGDQLLADARAVGSQDSCAISPNEVLGPGEVVVLDCGAAGIGADGACVVATIVQDREGVLDVRYFDTAEGCVVPLEGVPVEAVLKRAPS